MRRNKPLMARSLAVLLFALAGTAQAAEPFQLRTPTGSAVEFSGNSQAPVTVLLFWATWCPYCKALMPHLQSVVYQYDKDVQLYAISVAEDGDPAAFLAELGYDWTLLLEGDAVASRYGVRGTPGLVVIDRSGATVFDLSRVQASAALRERIAGADSRPKAAAQLAPFWAAELRRALDPAIRAAR
jgi:thiol-disulfide isomerase/thioredoxin